LTQSYAVAEALRELGPAEREFLLSDHGLLEVLTGGRVAARVELAPPQLACLWQAVDRLMILTGRSMQLVAEGKGAYWLVSPPDLREAARQRGLIPDVFDVSTAVRMGALERLGSRLRDVLSDTCVKPFERAGAEPRGCPQRGEGAVPSL
jgi:hypothetical protein